MNRSISSVFKQSVKCYLNLKSNNNVNNKPNNKPNNNVNNKPNNKPNNNVNNKPNSQNIQDIVCPHIVSDEETAIHDKYLSLLTPYNLPPKLIERARISRQLHKKAWKAHQEAKKNQIRINVTLPFPKNIKVGQPLPTNLLPHTTITTLQNYKTSLQDQALHPAFSKGVGKSSSKKFSLEVKKANKALNNVLSYANRPTFKLLKKNTNSSLLPASIQFIKKTRFGKNLNTYQQKLSTLSFNYYKKMAGQTYPLKIAHLRDQIRKIFIKKKRKIKVKSSSSSKRKLKFKTKLPPTFPLLKPWIKQGREKYQNLRKTLLHFKSKLKQKRKKAGLWVLTPHYKKIIKQLKKKRKFSPYGRYGAKNKFTRRTERAKARSLRIERQKRQPTFKRQSLYLQHKRLSTLYNNLDLTHKYLHMLVIIWYILTAHYIVVYKHMLQADMWLTYFYKNVWISYAELRTINLSLNYIISSGLHAHYAATDIYLPSRNPINYELQTFKYYQRMVTNKGNSKGKNTQHFLTLKRRKNIRTFFRISSKLKMGPNHLKANRFGKSINNNGKISKRLTDKEWLLVKKFSRRRYQHQFPVLFSEWKNIKKIQGYIDNQLPAWHQPYVVTHPYYYTIRYNTFVYNTANN